jgi:sulfur-oxidizing protein SoxB
MSAYIEGVRAPFRAKLEEPLSLTEGLLYRRGNFNGTWDQLILDALLEQKEAEIAFSPGFRWGPTLLAGETIRFEHLMDQTAITYPHSTLNELNGAEIKSILEDIADNLFNPDPYLQQGGDMVRVAGMSYSCEPGARIGARISRMHLKGRPLDAGKRYKVAGWAPVAEGARGEPIWELVARHLRARKSVAPPRLSLPALEGVGGDRGISQ